MKEWNLLFMKNALIGNQKKFPTVCNFRESLISIFMGFWKAELLSCSSGRNERANSFASSTFSENFLSKMFVILD